MVCSLNGQIQIKVADDSLQVPCVNEVKLLNYHHSSSAPVVIIPDRASSSLHITVGLQMECSSSTSSGLHLEVPPRNFLALKRLQNVFTKHTWNNKSSTSSLARTCGTDTWGQRQWTPREAVLQRSFFFFALLRNATSQRLRTKHIIYSFEFSKVWTHDATQNPPQKQDEAFDVARITDPVLLWQYSAPVGALFCFASVIKVETSDQ